MEQSKKTLNIVTVGHVDHGKSTVLGRLLADTDALPEGKLEQVKAMCEKSSKPFEYAFLIDALKDEQAQGITIDSARVFFRTANRNYLFIDAPGHIEFLRNMVTGASRAEAALLVIDAKEGVQENSKRHAYLLSMLGVRQMAVLVNKMDLVSYEEERFRSIVAVYREFLLEIGIEPVCFIPVSGMKGDNIAGISDATRWYKGKTVLEVIESFRSETEALDKPFRMPVQDVYKFTKFGDDRRIIAGTVVSGKIRVGDEVLFYPSGKKSRVKSIEAFNKDPREEAAAGQATGVTLSEQLYLTRGDIAIKDETPRPHVTSRVKVSLFWLSPKPMVVDREYIFKLGTSKAVARLEEIKKVIDPSSLDVDSYKENIERNSVAECVLKFNSPIAFDLVENFIGTSRFVIVDDYDISGGGIILEALEDEQSWIRDKVLLRDYKWEKSMIPHDRRTEKYDHESAVIFITGEKDAGKKAIAKRLEEDLFGEGRLVYFLGIGNLLYGVDADIKGINDVRREHLRRLAEVAHIMLDSGMILIVTAIEITQEDKALMQTAIGADKIETVWVGKDVTTDIEFDLKIDRPRDITEVIDNIKKMLIEKSIIRKA